MAGGPARLRGGAAATLAALCAAALATPVARARSDAEQALVVQASGPSTRAYPVRSRVPGDATVRLDAGDSLTLLDARGTRRLRGPGSFRLSRPSESGSGELRRIAVILKSLVEPPRMKRRIAGLRGFGASRSWAASPAMADSLWFVDVDRGGRYCSPGDEAPDLRRLAIATAATVTIRRTEGEGQAGVVPFAATEATRPWPAELVPSRGRFSIALGDGPVQAIELVAVAAPDPAPDAVAAVLLENGCDRQLDFLVDRLASSAAP